MDDFPMDDFLQSLAMDQLDGDMLELAQVIGLDAFKKLIALYGNGDYLYVPKLAHLRIRARNRKMLREYQEGTTYKELARRYHLSDRSVRLAVKEEQERMHGCAKK